MNVQVTKFYVSSFLKNQTYFVPILIVFLQAQFLSLTQIFWVFALGSAASFLLEIPTGVFADFYGKKRTIVLAKVLIMFSFLLFANAHSFLFFVCAQVLYEIGKSFRSGTEAAYIYDYLSQDKSAPSYTEVKGKQKFWARVGEALATALGGLIAATFSFRMVFIVAAFPALLNVFNVLSWSHLDERREKRFLWSETKKHVAASFCRFCEYKVLRIILINVTLFTAAAAALATFTQPYMESLAIPIAYFGFIYSASLVVSALAVRYSYKVEEWFGQVPTVNALSFFAVFPVLFLGFGLKAVFGVFLFFVIVIIENIRSPILNTLFHDKVLSKERSTMGSLLEQAKSLGTLVLLPIIGFVVDTWSMAVALLMLAFLFFVNAVFFRVKK